MIDGNLTRHVIGKGGKSIKHIQSEAKVKITFTDQAETGKTKLMITGTNQNIAKATTAIENIIQTQENNTTEKATKATSTCKYHIEGSCKYGDKCWRNHGDKKQEQNNAATTSKHQTQEPRGSLPRNEPERRRATREEEAPTNRHTHRRYDDSDDRTYHHRRETRYNQVQHVRERSGHRPNTTQSRDQRSPRHSERQPRHPHRYNREAYDRAQELLDMMARN